MGSHTRKIVSYSNVAFIRKILDSHGVSSASQMYDIFRCASDFDRNSRHLMPTTLNCGATGRVSILDTYSIGALVHC